MTPGLTIKTQREQIGISLRELARRIECAASMMSDVEGNRRVPSPNLAHRIFVELAMPLEKRDDCVQTWTERLQHEMEAWASVAGGSCP